MNVDFVQAVKLFFANYLNFKGRSTRAEYWWAVLFCVLLSFVGNFLGATLSGLIGLVLFLPQLSIAVRRLHDINRSGWWILFFYALMVVGVVLIFVGFGFFGSSMDLSSEEAIADTMLANIEGGEANLGVAGLGYVVIIASVVWYLIWMCKAGGPDNQYGPDPYGEPEKY